MSQLEKTPEARQKEILIEELEKKIKKKRSTIKGLRTRLHNLQQNIEEMMKKSGNMAMSTMERMIKIQQELGELLRKLLKNKKILKKRDHKESAKDFLDSLENPMGEGEAFFEAFKEFTDGPKSSDFGEEEKANSRDIFEEFRPEPAKEEQRNIRKVYIRLSQAFHPDMAQDEAEEQLFHERMQQIVTAYKQHDIDTLLRMEQQYLGEEMEIEEENDQLNFLDAKIERLKREYTFLDNQAKRLSKEIKAIRQSDMGQALTFHDREEKYGYGMDAQAAEMDAAFSEMEKTKQIIEDALAKNRMTPELEQQLAPVLQESLTEEEMILDLLSMMGGEEPPEYFRYSASSPKRPAKFEEADTVIYNPRKNRKDIPSGLFRGAMGSVEDVIFEEGKYYYYVAFEPKVYEHLDEEFCEEWIEQQFEYGFVLCREASLKHAPASTKFDPYPSYEAGRRKLYDYLLDKKLRLSTAQSNRLKNILLFKPTQSDEENWYEFFLNRYKFPSKLEFRIAPNPFVRINAKTKVLFIGINEFDTYDGFIIAFQRKNKKTYELCPLQYINVDDPLEFAQLIEDYKLWAEYRLPAEELGFPFF